MRSSEQGIGPILSSTSRAFAALIARRGTRSGWAFPALAVATLASGSALAQDCRSYPAEQWLKPEQIQTKAEELGYAVRSVGEDDGCWEIKGTDKEGRKVEVYFDPVTAEVVKTKGD